MSGCSISPKTPSRSASARSCSSERLRGVSLTARQPAWVTQIRPSYESRHSSKTRGDACARSRIDAELGEAREQERSAEPREPALVGGAVGERVAPVPGQSGHPQPELPEEIGGRDLVAERLDALQREHQPDPLAALDRVEVGARADGDERDRGSRGARAGAPSPAAAPPAASPRAAARGRRRRGRPGARRRPPRAAAATSARRRPSRRAGARGGRARAGCPRGRRRSRPIYPLSDGDGRFHEDVRSHQSRDRRGARARAAARGRGDAGGDRCRRAGLPGLAGAHGQGARGRAAPALGPDARAAGGAGTAADERAGQAAGGGAGRDRLRGLVLRVVRRGGEARLRRHDPGAPARQADRRPEGADRRHRRDHALELPRRDDHAQGRAGARRRLHDRDQARRADAVDRARARRRSPPRRASPTVCSRSSPATGRTRP